VEDITLEDFDTLEGAPSRASGRRLKRIRFTRDRLWLLGLGTQRMQNPDESGSPLIDALTFTTRVAAPFRPRRLVLSAASLELPRTSSGSPLGLLWVDDVKIAAKSQFASAPGGFPASAFVGEADDSLVKFDTCPPGNEIEVNISSIPGWLSIIGEGDYLYVTAGMFGYAAGRE
jgi:hypothetical protein